MAANTTIPIRCTPFCRPCVNGYKHHDLLLALLINTDSLPRQHEHDNLSKMIKKHEASGWDKNSAILEKNDEYRFPLLHWACVLGKPRTVQWLLDNGFSPTVQSSTTKETAVHRILVTLPELVSSKTGRKAVFQTMLPGLRDCLKIGDDRQDTPLHVAAKRTIQDKTLNHFYEKLLHSLVLETQKMPEEEQSKILNAKNCTGDTVLHILATSNKSLLSMKILLDAGADILLTNKLSLSPLDIAEKSNVISIINLLKTCLLQGCWKPAGGKPLNKACNKHDEAKKRRSERKSSAMANWRMSDVGDKYVDRCSEGSLEKVALTQILQKELQLPVIQQLMNPCNEQVDADVNLVTSSNLVDTPVKEEEQPVETCQCPKEDTIPNIYTSEVEATEDHVSAKTNVDSPLLQMIQQAGVFPNLNTLIKNTRDEHSKKLEDLQKSLIESEEELNKLKEKENSIHENITRIREQLEVHAAALGQTTLDKEKICKKRKLLQDESDDLRKKMLCCENLLQSVSGNSDG